MCLYFTSSTYLLRDLFEILHCANQCLIKSFQCYINYDKLFCNCRQLFISLFKFNIIYEQKNRYDAICNAKTTTLTYTISVTPNSHVIYRPFKADVLMYSAPTVSTYIRCQYMLCIAYLFSKSDSRKKLLPS